MVMSGRHRYHRLGDLCYRGRRGVALPIRMAKNRVYRGLQV